MSGRIPIKLSVEVSRPANPVFPVYKGESFTIRAVLTDHGQPFTETLTSPKLYYQTPDMENTWWSLDAAQEGNVITVDFPATAIPNEERLNCFLGSAGENFHAAFTMDFRHSPGATPNEVELPVPVLDFDTIEVLHAPYYTKSEADAAFQPKGDYKTKQTAVSDPTAGNTPASAFISGITQNANGEIDPVKSPLPPFQAPLTFDNTPTEGSQNPVTSDGIKKAIDAATPSDYDAVKTQVQQNTTDIGTNTNAITGINAKIPAQASAQNQLADKAFVNSSIQTNTATFRGTYNLVTDLGLTVSATEEQVAAAIAMHLASLVPPVVPENNDYVFVQIPRATEDPSDFDPTVIVRYDRYKCTVEEAGSVVTRTWAFEFSLNNSSFTADQWAAINSGITSELVAKLGALPTAVDLAAALLAKYEKPLTGIPKSDLSSGVQASLDKADTAIQTVKVNGTALTPDANKAVDVTVPVTSVTVNGTSVMDGTVAKVTLGTAASKDVPATGNASTSQVVMGDDTRLTNARTPTAHASTHAADGSDPITPASIGAATSAQGEKADTAYQKPSTGIPKTDLASDVQSSLGKADTALQTAPVTSVNNKTGAVTLTASDVGALGNTGEQWIDGSIKAHDYLSADQLIVGTTSNGLIFSHDTFFVYATVKFNGTTIGTYKFPKDGSLEGNDGNIARLFDIYAAVRQIAPDFTAKAYVQNELCSYNGVIYRCKLGYTASSLSPKPNTDTTHWEAKKVSELLAAFTVKSVKRNGTALTPDANGAVDVPVPVKATTTPVIAGMAAIGDSAKFAAENHVHPAETEVVEYRLPDDCFPITYTYNGTDYTIANNDGLRFDAGAGCEVFDVANGQIISIFNLPDLTWYGIDWTPPYDISNLKFANTAPTPRTWPVLEKDTVFVREVQVAKDADVKTALAGKLGNTGDQTLDGTLEILAGGEQIPTRIEAGRIILDNDSVGRATISIPFKPATADTLALLSQVYAAVQQIAPAWVGGTSYDKDVLVSYNGVVYCKRTASSVSQVDPSSDSVNWEAKKVSELLALLAPLASPAFTGTPTAPTPTAGDDSTKVATTAFVKTAIAGATPNLDYVMRVDPETGNIYYTTPDANANA